ncbi:MAG: hypothetical protein WAN59_11390 [Candidatus Baltobacteraceae bacterium]
MIASEERTVLDALFGPGVEEWVEGGRRLIILPTVTLPKGCAPAAAFGIYVASQYGGYESRLFLDCHVRLASGATPSMTRDVLCGRTMYSASWNGVPASLPPHQAVLAHLRRYEAAA